MAMLHVIERGDYPQNLVCLDRARHEWESGNWYMSSETAQRLPGGMLYLHEAQDKRARFGGHILGVRMVIDEKGKERAVFRFRAMREAVGVWAGLDGWSQEMKTVW